MQISSNQIAQVNQQIQALLNANNFYGKKIKKKLAYPAFSPQKISKIFHFLKKNDLRNAYPLGLMTAPEEKKLFESTLLPEQPGFRLLFHTQLIAKDVDDWAIMFKRCYEMAGMTNMDRIQITPGYGLWTAGIGFQAGAEKLGAMVIPMGTREHRQTVTDDDGYENNRSWFYLILCSSSCRRNPKTRD